MSLTLTPAVNVDDSFPRVSGDEPLEEMGVPVTVVFSPRERG